MWRKDFQGCQKLKTTVKSRISCLALAEKNGVFYGPTHIFNSAAHPANAIFPTNVAPFREKYTGFPRI